MTGHGREHQFDERPGLCCVIGLDRSGGLIDRASPSWSRKFRFKMPLFRLDASIRDAICVTRPLLGHLYPHIALADTPHGVEQQRAIVDSCKKRVHENMRVVRARVLGDPKRISAIMQPRLQQRIEQEKQ